MTAPRHPHEIVEANLRHAMAFYARTQAGGEARELPGVLAVSCGMDYPVFNSALLRSPVPGADGDLSSRLAMASIHFRALGVGWSYWICHDLLDERSLKQLRESCYAYRLEPVVTAPGMLVREWKAPARALPEVEVREVRGAAARTAFAHLIASIFELPFQMTMNMYGTEAAWTEEYAGFLGYVDGKPVTTAMVNISNGCCGYYSVGTAPGYRRRGYAEAVMREAERQMRKRLPFECSVLQSSTVGRRLYEQMGFREVTRFSVFRSVPGKK
jgi:ribosomal protein S18 acetylase RimI-like enzyme